MPFAFPFIPSSYLNLKVETREARVKLNTANYRIIGGFVDLESTWVTLINYLEVINILLYAAPTSAVSCDSAYSLLA